MKKIVAVLLLSTSIACGDATGPSSVTGNYTLRTINDASLPVILDDSTDYRLEITDGEVNLDSDESFSDITYYRETSGTQVITDTQVFQGTYFRAGNNITFTTTDGDSYTMALDGRSLTQNVQGTIFIYER